MIRNIYLLCWILRPVFILAAYILRLVFKLAAYIIIASFWLEFLIVKYAIVILFVMPFRVAANVRAERSARRIANYESILREYIDR
jgi:hypothetical protein